MVSNILRWSAKGLFALLLLLILLITSFRLAASIRETGSRAELAPRTGRLVPTGSGGVFVQEKGPADGIPVVLFHGTAAWSELWRRTSDALAAAGFHVIALDLPPFGFSDRPGSYTRQDQAARISDVLGALKVTPAITITNPVATTTLLKSMIAKKERALPEYVAILQRPTTQRESTPDIADWLYYFLGAERAAVSADRSAYAKLKVPAAILWGDKDALTPLEQALDLRALLPPETRLTLLPGLGHIPQIEDPDMFNDALLNAVGTL